MNDMLVTHSNAVNDLGTMERSRTKKILEMRISEKNCIGYWEQNQTSVL